MNIMIGTLVFSKLDYKEPKFIGAKESRHLDFTHQSQLLYGNTRLFEVYPKRHLSYVVRTNIAVFFI